MTNLITIQFDGGCSRNPGEKYGSFAVWHQFEQVTPRLLVKRLRIRFGYGTNNEAEFDSLLAGLEWTREHLEIGGFKPKDFSVKMITDSSVVGFRISRTNTSGKSEPEKRMSALTARCLEYLIPFREFTIDLVGRQLNVALFGH